jgi:hypothetical protein
MRSWVAVVVLLALLGACTAERTKIVRTESISSDYTSYAYNLSSPQGDLPHQVFLRPYNDGGMLAVCGYITGSATGSAQDLIEGWWRKAQLSLDGHRVGTGHFLQLRQPTDLRASCVETPVAWKETFQSVPLRLQANGSEIRNIR